MVNPLSWLCCKSGSRSQKHWCDEESTSPDIVLSKEGKLVKCSASRFNPEWKLRYFWLFSDGTVESAESLYSKTFYRTRLCNDSAVFLCERDGRYCVKVSFTGLSNIYYLEAPSRAELLQWVIAFRSIIVNLKKEQDDSEGTIELKQTSMNTGSDIAVKEHDIIINDILTSEEISYSSSFDDSSPTMINRDNIRDDLKISENVNKIHKPHNMSVIGHEGCISYQVIIHNIQCRNLKNSDKFGRFGNRKLSSRCVFHFGKSDSESLVQKKTKDPSWEETFIFQYNVSDVKELMKPGVVLKVECFDCKTSGSGNIIGSFEISLIDVASGPVHYDYLLLDSNGKSTGRILFNLEMQQWREWDIGFATNIVLSDDTLYLSETIHTNNSFSLQNRDTSRDKYIVRLKQTTSGEEEGAILDTYTPKCLQSISREYPTPISPRRRRRSFFKQENNQIFDSFKVDADNIDAVKQNKEINSALRRVKNALTGMKRLSQHSSAKKQQKVSNSSVSPIISPIVSPSSSRKSITNASSRELIIDTSSGDNNNNNSKTPTRGAMRRVRNVFSAIKKKSPRANTKTLLTDKTNRKIEPPLKSPIKVPFPSKEEAVVQNNIYWGKEEIPKLSISGTFGALTSGSIQVMILRIDTRKQKDENVGQKRFILIGQCWVSLQKAYEVDSHRVDGDLQGCRVANCTQMISLNGRKVGVAEITIYFGPAPETKQISSGVRSERGITAASAIIVGPGAKLFKTGKVLPPKMQALQSKFQKFREAQLKSDRASKLLREMTELMLQSDKRTMLCFLYSLKEAQELILYVSTFLRHKSHVTRGKTRWELHQLLLVLLKRGEVSDVELLGFNLTHLTDMKTKSQYGRPSVKLCIKQRGLLLACLEEVVTFILRGRTISPNELDYAAKIMALCAIRNSKIRRGLFQAVLSQAEEKKEIRQWQNVNFFLDEKLYFPGEAPLAPPLKPRLKLNKLDTKDSKNDPGIVAVRSMSFPQKQNKRNRRSSAVSQDVSLLVLDWHLVDDLIRSDANAGQNILDKQENKFWNPRYSQVWANKLRGSSTKTEDNTVFNNLVDSCESGGVSTTGTLLFHKFAEAWLNNVIEYVGLFESSKRFGKKNLAWEDIPGYRILLRIVMIQLDGSAPHLWPDSLIELCTSLLCDSRNITPFVRIAFEKTNMNSSIQCVKATIDTVAMWMRHSRIGWKSIKTIWKQSLECLCRPHLPATFDFIFFQECFRRLLTNPKISIVLKGIWLLGNEWDSLPPTEARRFSQWILNRHFYRILLHWWRPHCAPLMAKLTLYRLLRERFWHETEDNDANNHIQKFQVRGTMSSVIQSKKTFMKSSSFFETLEPKNETMKKSFDLSELRDKMLQTVGKNCTSCSSWRMCGNRQSIRHESSARLRKCLDGIKEVEGMDIINWLSSMEEINTDVAHSMANIMVQSGLLYCIRENLNIATSLDEKFSNVDEIPSIPSLASKSSFSEASGIAILELQEKPNDINEEISFSVESTYACLPHTKYNKIESDDSSKVSEINIPTIAGLGHGIAESNIPVVFKCHEESSSLDVDVSSRRVFMAMIRHLQRMLIPFCGGELKRISLLLPQLKQTLEERKEYFQSDNWKAKIKHNVEASANLAREEFKSGCQLQEADIKLKTASISRQAAAKAHRASLMQDSRNVDRAVQVATETSRNVDVTNALTLLQKLQTEIDDLEETFKLYEDINDVIPVLKCMEYFDKTTLKCVTLPPDIETYSSSPSNDDTKQDDGVCIPSSSSSISDSKYIAASFSDDYKRSYVVRESIVAYSLTSLYTEDMILSNSLACDNIVSLPEFACELVPHS